MRALAIVFRYELWMLLRSRPFLLLIGLACWVEGVMYFEGVRAMDYNTAHSVLGDEMHIIYLIATAYVGLFAINRLRTTGVQPLLMACPIPTPAWFVGQWLAGLCALMIPLSILLYPAGFLMRHRYMIDYSGETTLYVQLFTTLPAVAVILALAIWMRTLFKNNIMAMIVLALVFGAMAWLANSNLLRQIDPSSGRSILRAVPLIQYFSESHYNQIRHVLDRGSAVFTQWEDWRNLLAPFALAGVFLLLAGYHLRRTEPQRKVLGNYGRRWYHAPTFARMAFDLKTDPHISIRQHVTLALLILFVGSQGLWTLAGDVLRPLVADKREAVTDAGYEWHDPHIFTDEQILKATIHGEKRIQTPENLEIDLTLSTDGETSGRQMMISGSAFYQYRDPQVTMGGAPLPAEMHRRTLFIDSGGFETIPADQRFELHISARKDPTAREAVGAGLQTVSLRSVGLVTGRQVYQKPDGSSDYTWATNRGETWPLELELAVPADYELLVAPIAVEPENSDRRATYRMNVPAALNGWTQNLLFDNSGRLGVVSLSDLKPDVRFIVPVAMRKVTREMLELARPTIEEFSRLHRIEPDQPVWIIVRQLRNNQIGYTLNEIRQGWAIIHQRGRLPNWRQSHFIDRIEGMQMLILATLYSSEFEYGGRHSISNFYDLGQFLPIEQYRYGQYVQSGVFAGTGANLIRGLNQHLSLVNRFIPFPFEPVPATVNRTNYRHWEGKTRQTLLEEKRIPIFQMLYLQLGHEQWQEMIRRLKIRIRTADFDATMLQSVAEEAHGKSLQQFFDYWTRDGEGYPVYEIDSATAGIRTDPNDESTLYDVTVSVANRGSGRMPVPVQLTTSKGVIEEKLWIGPGEIVPWSVTTRDVPRTVAVDPQGWILSGPKWNADGGYWEDPNRNMGVAVESPGT